MSTEEQQIQSTFTTEEVQYEQYESDDDDNDALQGLQQQEETHQDIQQTVASSSTVESSNRTLRGDENVEQQNNPPRLNKLGIPTSYVKLSDRYTFSFSADLISQV